MIRFAMMLCLSALLSACQPDKEATAAAKAAFVLPGDYSELTTVADLQAAFGKSNVKVIEEADSSGKRSRSVVLFPKDPKRRAYVSFHDDQSLKGVQSIAVRDAGSKWRGKRDVYVGMSFAELHKVNGKPFVVSGFDAQRRGSVHDGWSPSLSDEDSSLGALDVEEGDHMYFNVEIGLRGAEKDLVTEALPVDESILSDDPRYLRLGQLLVVTEFSGSTSLDDEWQ